MDEFIKKLKNKDNSEIELKCNKCLNFALIPYIVKIAPTQLVNHAFNTIMMLLEMNVSIVMV